MKYTVLLLTLTLLLVGCAPVLGDAGTVVPGAWEDIALPARCDAAQRLSVPGGWLVRTVTGYESGSLIYVPDLAHEWGQLPVRPASFQFGFGQPLPVPPVPSPDLVPDAGQ